MGEGQNDKRGGADSDGRVAGEMIQKRWYKRDDD